MQTQTTSPSISDWLRAISGGAGIGGLFGSAFGSGDLGDALRGSTDQMQQHYQQALGYMAPYMSAGNQAIGNLQQRYQEMQNPQNYINSIMQNYQENPAARYQRQQGLGSINANLATQGLTGSGAEAKALQNYGQQLTDQQQQQYLNNALGVNAAYLQGQQGLYGGGRLSASQAGDWGMDLGKAIAEAQALAAKQEAEGGSDMFGALGGLISGAGAFFL